MLNWILLFAVCVFAGGMYGPLVRLSQIDGKIGYDTSQAVFFNEFFKLMVSFTLLRQTQSPGRFSLREGLPYAVPGLCYFITNNTTFYILSELDPVTFSVLSNVKILTTTAFYVLIIKRYPNSVQLLALAILLMASVVHSWSAANEGRAKEAPPLTDDGLEMRVSVYGIFLLLGSVCMSSFAAVFTELTVKKDLKMSLHKQNIYLYLVGMSFNVFNTLWKMSRSTDVWTPLKGFNLYTWIVVANTVLQGLCVSVIMKHSTNITRLVLTCASLVVSTLMSLLLFNLQITSYSLLSMFLIIIALVLYNVASEQPKLKQKFTTASV